MTINVREISIVGFRGARFRLPLDFTKDHISISVYGDNAGGKSTITDALEWFLLGKVEHLWREDCKEAALRNVFLAPEDLCEVQVRFSDAALDNARSLSADLKTNIKNYSPAFVSFLAAVAAERVFLRHSQITRFIGENKSKKRAEIAAIIGYNDIVKFRDAIQSAYNALRRDGSYIAAKQQAEDAKDRYFKLTKTVISTEEELFKKATGVAATFDLQINIVDDPSYDQTLEQLRVKIAKPESAAKKLRLEQLKRDCAEFCKDLPQVLQQMDAFLKKYDELVEDRAAVSQINIEQFLVQGTNVINGGYFTEEKCPFCLTPYDLQALKNEVDARVKKIADIRERYETVDGAKTSFLTALGSLGALGKRLETEYPEIEGIQRLATACGPILEMLRSWFKSTSANYKKFERIEIPSVAMDDLRTFSALVHSYIQASDDKIAALALTEREKTLLNTIEMVRDARVQYREYEKQNRIVKRFEAQILALSSIFNSFVAVQNSAIQAVLDKISKDVGSFYKALHPSENVDDVRLRVVGEEGIEFEYSFHRRPTHPPMKYLSESHLNSLGICLFLASAKLFNKVSNFFVLDDVVTSFDIGHRRRLVRLLREEFSDWQIILLTHEHVWFDLLKREMANRWAFKEVEWDADNGVSISPSAKDLSALIAEKRKKYDVSNDVRRLIEASLKEVCRAVQAKVSFRFNDQNERRMGGELLSELRATVNRKCPSLKGHSVFAQLEASNLVATIGSHDNPAEKITDGDIDVALAYIEAMTKLFFCDECGGYVDAERKISGQNKITCKCGKTALDWKE